MMNILKLTACIFACLFCSAVWASNFKKSAFESSIVPVLPENLEVEKSALLDWVVPKGYETRDLPKLRSIPTCAQGRLYPAHPTQEQKQYHVYRVARFDHRKISGASSLCRIPDPHKRHCLKSDEFHFVILSDTYELFCENIYSGLVRAFFRVSFIKSEESMGTLFSLGRTLYPKSKSQFPGETWVGPTFWIEPREVLGVSSLSSAETERTQQLRARAIAGSHDIQDNLFIPRVWDPLWIEMFRDR